MGLGYVHRFFKVRCLNEVERHYGPVTRRSGRISQANALVAQDARFEPRPSFICFNAQALTSSVRRFCSSSERVLWPWRKIKTNPAFTLAPCRGPRGLCREDCCRTSDQKDNHHHRYQPPISLSMNEVCHAIFTSC